MQLNSNEKLIWAGEETIPANLQQAAGGRWEVVSPSPEALRTELAEGVIAAVLDETTAGVEEILRNLSTVGIVAIVLGEDVEFKSIEAEVPLLRVSRSVSAEQLRVQLDSAVAIRPALAKTFEELTAARSLAKYAARTADELDEEMQLASRLQQDFLPRQLPKVGSVRFGVFFQPASFVSGDLYDTTRLDETHVGFYIADAVGHGLPAALLTMFIKEALQTKRITGNSYEILPPHEALAQLNADLCRQQLTMCEFCTGLYGIIDTSTLMATMSRAGHPAPILMNADGVRELDLPGPLLGIMDDAIFESCRFQLAKGDKLMLYSDGLEDCFTRGEAYTSTLIVEAIEPLAKLPRDQFIHQISEMVNQSDINDDVTVLLMEV